MNFNEVPTTAITVAKVSNLLLVVPGRLAFVVVGKGAAEVVVVGEVLGAHEDRRVLGCVGGFTL